MEEEVLYKNNPAIESSKRINMAYLLLTNPEMVEAIQKSSGHFFHGTNANALPSILKYGINSAATSIENNIAVTTGERQIKTNEKKRNFVSLTDCLNIAQIYANMGNPTNELLNFGVIIGTSFESMDGIKAFGVTTDLESEIGVVGNIPLDHIKFLAVPDDKVEFVKKMVGQRDIDVVSMNIRDPFFRSPTIEKLRMLEQGKENIRSPKSTVSNIF